MNPPVALTIAGSDSGGGAGIQGDLRTFAAHGVFATTAVTAVTAQNTVEVRAVHALPPELVAAQVEAVLDDLPVATVKTGMLATAAITGAVADLAVAGRLANLVVDPVMVSSSGARLLEADAEAAYVERLLPVAAVLTPNRAEAAVLCGGEIRSLADQREAARALAGHGTAVVVVTGGHPAAGSGGDAVDVVADGRTGRVRELRTPWVESGNVHGTGCSFAAAIAAGVARGLGVDDAIVRAKAFVHAAIAGSVRWRIGTGHGPLDHFGWHQEEER